VVRRDTEPSGRLKTQNKQLLNYKYLKQLQQQQYTENTKTTTITTTTTSDPGSQAASQL